MSVDRNNKTKREKVEDSFHMQTMCHYNLIPKNMNKETSFIQAFICEIEVTQTKDERGSNKVEWYMAVKRKSVNASNLWYLDTGAIHHLTHNKTLLHNY